MTSVRLGVLGGRRTVRAVEDALGTPDGVCRTPRPPWDAVVALGGQAAELPVVGELAAGGVPLLVRPRLARQLPPSANRVLVLRPGPYLPGIDTLRREAAATDGPVSAWLRVAVPGGLPRGEAALGRRIEGALALLLAVVGEDVRAARAWRFAEDDGGERIRIGVAVGASGYAETELFGVPAPRGDAAPGGGIRVRLDTTLGAYTWHRYADGERLRLERHEPDPTSGHNVARGSFGGDPLGPAVRALVEVARGTHPPPWGASAERQLRNLVSRSLELLRHPAPASSERGTFLLVQLPRRRAPGDALRLPNLGLARLAGALRRDGVPVRLADLDAAAWQDGLPLSVLDDDALLAGALDTGEEPPGLQVALEALVARLPLARAAVVGFSVVDRDGAAHLAMARLLARRVRALRPDALIVLGGVVDELHSAEVLPAEPAIDVIVEGDGEVAARRLYEAHTWGLGTPAHAPHVCRRAGDGVLRPGRRTVRLARRPVPDFSGFPLDAYRRGISGELRAALVDAGHTVPETPPRLYLPYSFVLGCLGRCTFCGFGDRVDLQTEDRTVAQLATLAERHDCRDFVFLNTTVNLAPRRLERLCDALVDADLDLRWIDSARPHGISDKLAAKMRRAGCVMLSFGVESGSDAVLRRMGKGFARSEVEETLAAVHRAGILTRVNLIAGYLHETDVDVAATVSLVDDHHAHIDLIGCFNGFQLLPTAGFDPGVHGICLHGTMDLVDPDQLSLAYDEVGGLAWPEKQARIRRSRRTVLQSIDERRIYRRAFVDEYDLFWLSRRFDDPATVRRFLLRLPPPEADRAARSGDAPESPVALGGFDGNPTPGAS